MNRTMKKIAWICGLALWGSLMAVGCYAQTYGQMWKKVESLQQQDLPRSMLEALAEITAKATAEHNVPQLMKATLLRSATRIQLTPDSAAAEREALREWAGSEQDPVAKAVLWHVMGTRWLEAFPNDTREAIRCFRRSLQDGQRLAEVDARSFRPMTVSGTLSERYFDDNLYDLLVRQAIRRLSTQADWTQRNEALEVCYDWYGQLYGHYAAKGLRAAAFLTREAQLWFRLEQMGHLRRYALAPDEAERQLWELAEAYADLPVAADAYTKLAEWHYRADRRAKVAEVAEEGLRRYPKGEWAAELRRYLRMAQRPSLQVRIPFAYPGRTADVEVSFANLTGVTFEWYRLNLPSLSPRLREERKAAELLKQYGRKVASASCRLVPRKDYAQADTTLRVALPEAGIYVMRQVPEGHADRAACTLVRLSPYQAVCLPVDKTRSEWVAVDKLTGQPVPGAELAVYTYEQGEYRLRRVCPTDAKGSTMLELPQTGNWYAHVRTAGNDYMPLERLGRAWAPTSVGSGEEEGRLRASLFTDRALYRPGQAVHVSGVVWRQYGDSARVAEGVRQVLTLSSGGDEVARQEVVADAMGTFRADFVLPQPLRPGTYLLRTPQAVRTLRVEEYRRPTFEVAFQPCPSAYTAGDSVCLTARAATFAGAPVREAAVRWRLVRQERRWFRWGAVHEEELLAAEAATDAEGRFQVAGRLAAPADWRPDEPGTGGRYYVYRFEAAVTDKAGETRTAQSDLPVAQRSVGLQAKGLPEVWLKERPAPIQFQALNLNDQPVALTVGWQVWSVDQQGNPVAAVCQGEAASNRSCLPEGWQELPSGRYRLLLTATDDQGRRCEARQDFLVFSQHDRTVPYETAAWFYQDAATFPADDTPDGQPACYVGTSLRDVYLMVDVYSGDRRIESRRLQLDREVQALRFPYRADYGDGLLVSLAFVKEGAFYTRTFRIERPLPEKRLQLQWTSFRDRLQPGSEEEWKLRVTGRDGRPVQACLMATLYDASLDALSPHDWNFSLGQVRRLPAYRPGTAGSGATVWLAAEFPYLPLTGGIRVLDGDYSRLFETVPWQGRRLYALPADLRAENGVLAARGDVGLQMAAARSDAGLRMKTALPPAAAEAVAMETAEEADDGQAFGTGAAAEEFPPVALRGDFSETAFFYPCLATDSLGEVGWRFTLPDALTRWRLLAFAHTADMDYGLCRAEATASKDFMVQPHLPRFLRRGDRAVVAASLVNLSQQAVKGKACLELRDPMTERVVKRSVCPFEVAEGATGQVAFDLQVPEGHDLLVCRMAADGGSLADGEQRYLPVLSDRQWVTETVPFVLADGEERTVRQQDLFNRQSRTAEGHRLTVELTARPDGLALQALPVLGDPQTEDALAWGTAFYAQSLAAFIVDSRPHLRRQLEAWRQQAVTAGEAAGRLAADADLKDLLLEESPWLLEAREEGERLRRMALFFELNGMKQRRQTAIDRLRELQGADGSWSWYRGMEGSRAVTVRLVELLARLQAMGVDVGDDARQLYFRGLGWLKGQVEACYRRQQEQPSTEASLAPASYVVHYLYCCAVDPEAAARADRKVNDGFLRQLEDRSAEYSIREKALIALVLHGAGRQQQAATLVRSIREYLTGTDETGRYFDTPKAGYSWESYRIPTQVAALEALVRIAPDEAVVEAMKWWLLRQKQVQVWESPLATADALYAFFCLGTPRPEQGGTLTAQVGREQVVTPDDGLGYVRRTCTGTDAVRPDIRIRREGEGRGWGAVYAQYSEKMGRVKAAASQGLQLERTYLRHGKALTAADRLTVGDRLTVRLTLTADRDMDFIQLKDSRPACMEPVEALSGYGWQNGTPCFRAFREASVQFFIDRLRKGTHVLEYEVFIDRAGTYQAGSATAQSAYSPEWAAHTGGGAFKSTMM